MSFEIIEHEIPCAYIRESPQAVRDGARGDLKLAVKQYIPRGPAPSEGAFSIIAAHGNGFPKELYEPLWDELLLASREHKFGIRAIWIADMAQQGASGVLNEDILGDDHHYFDHSRDLLHMVNTFRHEMPEPIIGIGHSMGALQLVKLATLHPRLFVSLIFIDPMIQSEMPPGPNVALLTTFRRDVWPSLADAERSIRKSKFYSSWDERVLQKFLLHGLRPTPTSLNPISETNPAGSVTLTTTKHQEAWVFQRPNFQPQYSGKEKLNVSAKRQERLLSPDLDYEQEGAQVFHRAEPGIAESLLEIVWPPVFYLFGGRSPFSTPEKREMKLKITGRGVGGSGGSELSMVSAQVFPEGGHFLPFEMANSCAEAIASWLDTQVQRIASEAAFLSSHPSGKSDRNMQVVSQRWQEWVRKPYDVKRPSEHKL